jgi:hypothetical protein
MVCMHLHRAWRSFRLSSSSDFENTSINEMMYPLMKIISVGVNGDTADQILLVASIRTFSPSPQSHEIES